MLKATYVGVAPSKIMYHFVGSPVSLLTYGPVPIRTYGSSLCLLPFVCSLRGLKVFYTIPLLTACDVLVLFPFQL